MELERSSGSLYCIDFDFKAQWSVEERRAFDEVARVDLSRVHLGNLLVDYESREATFKEMVKNVSAALPGDKVCFRSSVSGGVHVYGFLDRKYPSAKITQEVRSFLESRGLDRVPVLDPILHPSASHHLRLPLGFGSVLLDSSNLEPKFPGRTVKSQVVPALTWLKEHESRINRVSLSSFKKARGRHRRKSGFDEAKHRRIYEEGILAPGTRWRRTRSMVVFGRHHGLYGDELHAFVDRWVERKHGGNSYDINEALRVDDMTPILSENRCLVEGYGRRYFTAPDKFWFPIPHSWLQAIVAKLQVHGRNSRSYFRLIEIAFRAHAAADYYSWLDAKGKGKVALSRSLWRKICGDDDFWVRDALEACGLLVKVSEHEQGRHGREGRAAIWHFSLLEPTNDQGVRVGLHDGLLDILGRSDINESFTSSQARRIKERARKESHLRLWGSGEIIEAMIEQLDQEARRRRSRRRKRAS